jgi:hypothetical protein
MSVTTRYRLIAVAASVLLGVLLAATTAAAAVRMPIGFFDDPSFRWSSQATKNLAAAAAAHGSVVLAQVNWETVAPTRPLHPLDGNDHAYRLSDVDALVGVAARYGLQVMLTISGTPSWANGGKAPNVAPTNLADLSHFAEMLAHRYDGKHGHGAVTRFEIWNEPNLGQFLTPQFRGDTIVSPALYAKLFMAAYTGIKAGNPRAIVAVGDTSNRGRNKPSGSPGTDSVAPATFAQLLAKAAPNLPIAAWATHPYPSNFALGPTQKVAFPNVAFSTMSEFGASLQKWFKRPVPIWVTEYAEETRPEYFLGVSYAKQAADAREALKLAAANPYVQMFVWFVFRDSAPGPFTWFSGLEKANGQKKPAYAAFALTASGIAGQTQTVRPGHPFSVTLAVPLMSYDNAPGAPVGISYVIRSGRKIVALGQPREPLQADQNVTFRVDFKPLKSKSYLLTATVNDRGGQRERVVCALLPASPTAVRPAA